ncbi:MAG TPA: type II toxin-antitoxin system VapC family toxin [Caulobacteraceae bacterium]|nr:type II toxin-antitoxin system VapC family toxin [Caulobacteraceae bacterium]
MILVDANLLLYASIEDFPQHRTALRWLDERLNGIARVGLAWGTLTAFLRLITNRRIFERPLGMGEAWEQVKAWLACDTVWTPTPTDRHAQVLEGMLGIPGVRGDLVPDAHLAALALEHGLELCSTDSDFARFPGLRWTNPLA